MVQLNDWLSIDKVSGTGNAEITLTASSYDELVERAASLKIQAQSINAILNVKQKAERSNDYFWVEFEEVGGAIQFVPKHLFGVLRWFQFWEVTDYLMSLRMHSQRVHTTLKIT